jgi:hypothetical protein
VEDIVKARVLVTVAISFLHSAKNTGSTNEKQKRAD